MKVTIICEIEGQQHGRMFKFTIKSPWGHWGTVTYWSATEQDTDRSRIRSHITSHCCKVLRLGCKWIMISAIQREKCSPLLLAAWEQRQKSIGATQGSASTNRFCSLKLALVYLLILTHGTVCVCVTVFQAFDRTIN